MPKLQINVAAATERFVLIPDGNYELKVNDIQLTKTKETQKPMLKVEYEVVDGEEVGKKLLGYLVLDTSFGQFELNQLCHAAGVPSVDPDTDDLIGVTVEAQVTREEKEGKDPQNRYKLLVEVSAEDETAEV